MALRRISPEDNSGDNLPWINEYLDDVGEPDDVSQVHAIKVTAKGLLVLCTDFKGFIFKQSGDYNHLMEAIPVWRTQKSLPFGVMGIAQRNGKLALAVDDEFTCTAVVDKKGNCDFKYSVTESGSDQMKSNPFLATLHIPPTTESHVQEAAKPSTRRPKVAL